MRLKFLQIKKKKNLLLKLLFIARQKKVHKAELMGYFWATINTLLQLLVQESWL